mmetsp:Transcript_33818/g.46355  ORF Transcript_33818/g.46355 Transcript_33818/m.46355 type:complete len:117 (-) Transcript_33818:193-543(-)
MKALVEALVGLEVNVTLEMDRAVGLEVDATLEMDIIVGLKVNVMLKMDRAVGLEVDTAVGLEVDATLEMGILVGGIVGTGDPAQAPGKQADHQAFANVQQELTGQHALPAKLAPPH